MSSAYNIYLITAASMSTVAALLHYACIIFGAPLYRALGAGDKFAHLAETGHTYPPVMAMVLGTVLLVPAVLSLSAAGVIRPLPLRALVLSGFTLVLTLRALFFPFLKPFFPGNTEFFWWMSSAICLVYALMHVLGLRQVWKSL
jgi:hypothetical protein